MTKFEPLHDFLMTQSVSILNLTFVQIEKIIKLPLPPEASKDRRWWSNEHDNPQSWAWFSAGWIVEDVNVRAGTVKFVKPEK